MTEKIKSILTDKDLLLVGKAIVTLLNDTEQRVADVKTELLYAKQATQREKEQKERIMKVHNIKFTCDNCCYSPKGVYSEDYIHEGFNTKECEFCSDCE